MLGTYFYHEILRKTIIGFGTLFNNINIRHLKNDGTVLDETKVGLSYGPMQKFLTKIQEQSNLDKSIALTLPRMSFEMTGMQYDSTRKTGITQTFKAVDGTNMKKVFMPIPYNITFELNIFSKLNDDSLQIIEQILPFFQPSFNLTVDLVSSIGEKRDIPIILDSIDFQDDYEGSFQTRRAIIHTLRFTAKTYLFGPIADTSDGLIRKVQADVYSDTNTKTAKREMRYTVVPDPINAEPDDDFGFTEDWQLLGDSRDYSPTRQNDVWWIMKEKYESIDKALNTESDIVDVKPIKKPEIIKSKDDDIEKDYVYSRANLYSLIEKGQEAINGIMEVAGEGGSPRAYEVAGQLIKSVADTTDKLIDLQKKLKDVEDETKKTTNNVTNNAVFVGSTSELQKMLKQGFLNNKE